MSQKEEIETIRERSIALKLSDADVNRICEKAGISGITVAELLQNFIGDLVDGTYTNGSDERERAQGWFDRCWFSAAIYDGSNFLQWLINRGDVEVVIDCWDDMGRCKDSADEDDQKDYADAKAELEAWFSEFLSQFGSEIKNPTLEDEMAAVIKWRNERQQLQFAVNE